MKQFFNSVFSKDSNHNAANPSFNVTQMAAQESDYEVTEISFEEYARYVTGQRRKIQAKQMQLAA